MEIKGLISEDFINYKKPSMTIMFPHCTFKCSEELCQNSPLAKQESIFLEIDDIVTRYINNPITESIVMQGLEPFDSWNDLLELIAKIRDFTDDDIVIYTGYNKDEIENKVCILSKYKNIIIKYGRYIPNQENHYDDVLGVYLASNNQYAEKIS